MIDPVLAIPRSYWAGCGLVIAGGLMLSLGILPLRAAATSDAWQYLFWRGIGFSASLTALTAWVEKGGLLIRFAGPRLAEATTPDPLLPVRLLNGDRQLGGTIRQSADDRIGHPVAHVRHHGPWRGHGKVGVAAPRTP